MKKDRRLASAKELSVLYSVDRGVVDAQIRRHGVPKRGECGCRLYDVDEVAEAFLGREGMERLRRAGEGCRLLSRQQSAAVLAVCPKTFDNLRKQDAFPEPVNVVQGGRTLRWLDTDLEAYALGVRERAYAQAA